MSLLLDARKKSHEAGNSDFELSLEDAPVRAEKHDPELSANMPDDARSSSENLFNAKVTPATARAGINRKLLIALGGTFLLLAAGGGYVWYEITPKTAPISRPALPPVMQAAQPSDSVAANEQPAIAPEAITPVVTAKRSIAKRSKPKPRSQSPVLIETIQPASIDQLLNDAYHAFQFGQLEQARNLYQQALKLDSRNIDALLGLAVIAQRSGADKIAVHYFLRALELNPRDPVANAGMSALTSAPGSESRLKILLNEQPDSAALHSALGSLFASEERWGEAQQSYFNAYKLEPKNALIAFNLAVSLDRLGQSKSAAQYYQLAVDLDPHNSAGFDHVPASQRAKELTQ